MCDRNIYQGLEKKGYFQHTLDKTSILTECLKALKKASLTWLCIIVNKKKHLTQLLGTF